MRRTGVALRWAGVLCAALVAGLALSCGGGSPGATPTPSATSSPSPAPDTATPAPPQTAYRFVWRQFGATEDTILRVAPDNPGQPETLAVVPHREGYGIKPSLSPDQELLAYVTYPESAYDASFQSDLYVLDLKTKEAKFITGQVDLHFKPLWSPDSRLLYVRRNIGQQVMVLQVKAPRTPKEGEPTPTPTPSPPPDQTPAPTEDPVRVAMEESVSRVLSFTPVGFADDGRSMFFVQVQGGTGGGTLLGEYAPATWEAVTKADAEAAAAQRAYEEAVQAAIAAGAPPPEPLPTPAPRTKLVADLTDQIASDFALSPDAHKFAFLAPQLVEGSEPGSVEIRARVWWTDLGTTATSPLPIDNLPPGDFLRPAWYPDSSRLTVGLLPADGRPGKLLTVPVAGGMPELLPTEASGYDVPVSWAPDGSYIAVIRDSGTSIGTPSRRRLVFVSPAGHRLDSGEGHDLEPLGWVQP
ncbi:MAG: hypothetical protein Q7T33_15750 [Dehalococcoidia bacterium]|nr:hypothetical protein [Dehalococcoidia bacterium]